MNLNFRKLIYLIISFITGLLIYHIYFTYSVAEGWEYFSDIPEFNEEKEEVIGATICDIYTRLDYPSSYYITDVDIKDSIHIVVDKLKRLQSGCSYSKRKEKRRMLIKSDVYLGSEIHFYFDKNYKFLSKRLHNEL